jgi:hypothetical protein
MTLKDLLKTNETGFFEMRFESVGGLGAILSGQPLAEAAGSAHGVCARRNNYS